MSQPPPDQNEAFALIIDTSSSAKAYLDEVCQTAYRIYSLISAEQFKIFMLGSTAPIPPAMLRQPEALRIKSQDGLCSLISPIMEAIVREEQNQSVIIVGSGEIFDLGDWVDSPQVEGWLLVHISEDLPLQGPGGRISEIGAYQLGDDVDTLLNYFSRFTPAPMDSSSHTHYANIYDWQVDDSGYPLIFVEPLKAYVHLFPVTKPQFEKFIASGKQRGLDDEWYATLSALNPRASYRSTDVIMLENLFMTGVSTAEALAFSRWLGRDYTLLSAEDWRICREWFKGRPAPSPLPELAESMSRDAIGIWEIIEEHWLDQNHEIDFQELSLMRQGILEWVAEIPGQYCGIGDPATSNILRQVYEPVRLRGNEPRRHRNLGFRLRTR